MTELKAGTRGTWTPRKTPATLICDGPDRFGQLAIKDVDGEYCVIDEVDFTPDPEPPTTVMVEMSVEDARSWVSEPVPMAWETSRDVRLIQAAAKALREVGIA